MSGNSSVLYTSMFILCLSSSSFCSLFAYSRSGSKTLSGASAWLRAKAVSSSLASLSSRLSVIASAIPLFSPERSPFGGGESKTEAKENAAWRDSDLPFRLSLCVLSDWFGHGGLLMAGKGSESRECLAGESCKFSIRLKGGDFGATCNFGGDLAATGESGNEGR